MPLEHEPLASTPRTHVPSAHLTPDELTELLNDAIARDGAASQERDHTLALHSLEDAVDIARQVGVSEESVREAARNLERRKTREQRRALVRAKRRRTLYALAAVAAVVGLPLALRAGIFPGLPLLALLVGVALVVGHLWVNGPVSDQEADRTELPPVAGTCRVCGAAATSPRSTFCERHQYKGPAS